MPKCGECREFPAERGKKCIIRWLALEEPGVEDPVCGCPCFHPAGEPTEGEMLDWMEKHLDELFQNDSGNWDLSWHEGSWLDYDKSHNTIRSAIREAMKGGNR